MSFIKMKDIYKVYNKKTLAIDDFNLEIEKNEFVALIGPSGCGKSTLLRMISGLEEINYGDLEIDGKRMNDVHAKDRDMAMVFQNYALYPHLTNFDNIAFGLKLRKIKKEIIKERVESVAELLDLKSYLDSYPSELSGGQRQRIALGRAMVQHSRIFLMDEPLSNLDAKLRNKMRVEILKLHRSLGITTIYVTHDQIEAMTMADKIVVMNKGVVQQIGSPHELYYNPKNIFVATFIGDPDINILKGIVKGTKLIIGKSELELETNLYPNLVQYNNKEVTVGIRAEDIKTENIYLETDSPKYSGRIELVEMRGDNSIILTKFEKTDINIKTQSNQIFHANQDIEFTIRTSKLFLFDQITGERI